MGLMDFQFKAPEVATIVRWLLRVVLVAFLAWLVKGRQTEPEEEEQEDENDNQTQGNANPRGQRLPNSSFNNRDGNRMPPRKDAYNQRGQDMRQRRPANDGPMDFDAVINKMSKPKQMWQQQTVPGAKPEILKQASSDDVAAQAAAPRKDSGGEPVAKKYPRTKEEEKTSYKAMLHGHARPVTWITWNRDGNLLFTCGKDKMCSVWSFPDGECLGSYEGHSGAVWACSVTADSSWLVTGGADQNVIVWEARTSRELARIGLAGVCRFVEWASGPTGDTTAYRLVTVHNKFGSNPPAITVFSFDGEAITKLHLITNLPAPATQVRWGFKDNLLASSHENGELIFWSADTGEEKRRLKAHDVMLSKFDFSLDRLLLATASTDMKVRVWDLGDEGCDAKMVYELETDRPLNAVAFGPLSRTAATGDASGRPAGCSVIAAGGQDIRDVANSSSSSDQFTTLLYRVGATALEADGATKGHFGPVHTLAFSLDGTAIASGSEDGCIRLHMFDDPGSK